MEEAIATVDLNGEFRFKADAKGRVSLPAKFRKVLPSDLVVTPDPSGTYLMLFTSDDFNQWVDTVITDALGEYKPTSKQHIGFRRALKARAKDVQVDSAGRVMIPVEQREMCDIRKDVAIVGNKGYFEMWDAKRYDEASEEFDVSSLLS